MRIDQTGRPAATASSRLRRNQPGFVVNEEASAAETETPDQVQAGPAIAAASVSAQSPAPSPAQQDQEAAEHGQAVLKALDRVQLSCLGLDGDDARAGLAALAGGLKQASDPGLNAVLQAIAARAAVELARME